MSKAEAKDKDGLSGVQPGLPTGGRGVCTTEMGVQKEEWVWVGEEVNDAEKKESRSGTRFLQEGGKDWRNGWFGLREEKREKNASPETERRMGQE